MEPLTAMPEDVTVTDATGVGTVGSVGSAGSSGTGIAGRDGMAIFGNFGSENGSLSFTIDPIDPTVTLAKFGFFIPAIIPDNPFAIPFLAPATTSVAAPTLGNVGVFMLTLGKETVPDTVGSDALGNVGVFMLTFTGKFISAILHHHTQAHRLHQR